MKDKDFDFDTNELLSSLDKLKAKYSFDFDSAKEDASDKSNTPVVDEVSPVSEADDEVIAVPAADESVSPEVDIFDDIPAVKEESSSPAPDDMSWLIDNDDVQHDDEISVETPMPDLPSEPIVEQELSISPEPEAEPEVEPENAVAWYLTTEDDEPEQAQAEDMPLIVNDIEPEVEETIIFEDISSQPEPSEEAEEVEESEEVEEVSEDESNDEDDYEVEQITPPATEEAVAEADEDDEFDEFDDLDDDLVVIKHDETESKDSQTKDKASEEPRIEDSPFYAAFADSLKNDAPASAPPKAVKSPKPAKPVKEPKVKKEKQPKENNPDKKPRKKLIMNIIVAVALVLALWGCVFATDIILVSNWSAPVFCSESEAYDDGSRTYTGAFYQIQVSVDENGKIQRVVLPWFAKGPNGDK